MPIYTSHGYELSSQWALPAGTKLGPNHEGPSGGLHVQAGPVAWEEPFHTSEEQAVFSQDEHKLFWPILGKVSITRAGQVYIDAATHAPDGIIPHAILGPIIAHWIMMNDGIALHANCVDIGGKLIAIVGESGAGKSSLCAALVAGGALPHSDDIVSVDPHNARVPFGTARLKLNSDVFALLNLNALSVGPVYSGIDKLSVEMPLPPDLSARPLSAVYRLLDAAADAEPEFVPVNGFLAAFTLFSEIFRVNTAAQAFGAEALLGRCAALVGRVKVFELRRHRDLSRIQNLAAAVMSHSRSVD